LLNSSLVSVIIPLYNSAKYIKDAINSVLDQSFKNVEIIIVDDGSTDNIIEVLSDYIENNQISYYYQENKGAASARNLGLTKCKGSFISFLDSDDLWYKNKLQLQIEFLEQNKHIDLLLTNIEVTNQKGEFLYFHSNRLPNTKQKIIKAFFNSKIIMNTPTIIFKKSILNQVPGFNPTLRYREDHLFLMDVAFNFNIAILDKFLIKRRIFKSSTSHSLNVSSLLEIQKPFIELAISKYNFLNKNIEIARIYFEMAKNKSLLKVYRIKYAFYSIFYFPFNWKVYLVILNEILFLNFNFSHLKHKKWLK